jgi:hypothetical protein
LEHGAVPSSQYSLAEMALNETGSKPAGTGPPAGPPPGRVAPVVAGADVVVGATTEVVVVPCTEVVVVPCTDVVVIAGSPDVVVAEPDALVVEVPVALLELEPHPAITTPAREMAPNRAPHLVVVILC